MRSLCLASAPPACVRQNSRSLPSNKCGDGKIKGLLNIFGQNVPNLVDWDEKPPLLDRADPPMMRPRVQQTLPMPPLLRPAPPECSKCSGKLPAILRARPARSRPREVDPHEGRSG